MSESIERDVASHYGRAGLLDKILDGLKASGADLDAIKVEDLAPVDEFHTAGRQTTVMAFAKMPLKSGMHVLDAGCGIGGSSRALAREHGCRVTGIDLTPEYVDVARDLTARMGLADACQFEVASATDLPFDNENFDAAINFHVAMNIADRDRLYGELARVLRPHATLCLFDVMKGPAAGMLYPVPWAETEATSFLRSRDETAAFLDAAGFDVVAEENLRPFAQEFFREVFAKAATADGPPPLGLHILTGANTPEKFTNYASALVAHQIEPVIMVAKKR